jgi:hypothetical protein
MQPGIDLIYGVTAAALRPRNCGTPATVSHDTPQRRQGGVRGVCADETAENGTAGVGPEFVRLSPDAAIRDPEYRPMEAWLRVLQLAGFSGAALHPDLYMGSRLKASTLPEFLASAARPFVR